MRAMKRLMILVCAAILMAACGNKEEHAVENYNAVEL